MVFSLLPNRSAFEKWHKDIPSVFENAQLAIVRSLGLGCVPNEPGVEIGAGPDLYTA